MYYSEESQVQETYLAPSAYQQTRNYDAECSNHHSSLSPKGTSTIVASEITSLLFN